VNRLEGTRRLLVAAGLGLALAGLSACSNPEVPTGFEGYVYHVPLIFGKMEYRESLVGPTSTGASWRLYVTNIDMREKTYPESFDLLTHDDLKVKFEVNTRIRLRRGSVREIVEKWGGPDWYEWNVKEPLRTVVRLELMKVSAATLQLETAKVAGRIQEALALKYKEQPIEVISVDIGHFEFPAEVTAAIQDKIASEQELERQQYVLSKTEKEAAIRVLEALNVARQQQIISSTLDPLYVQRKAVEVYRKLATTTNKTIVMLPTSDTGTGMPLVLAEGKRKTLTAADQELLKKMEEKYLKDVPAMGPGGAATPVPGESMAPAMPPAEGALTPVVPPVTPPAAAAPAPPPAGAPQ
jgi:regulator of protease activity HflC (stomatin/prohibitin superfamily)